jgi:hypothetical protein
MPNPPELRFVIDVHLLRLEPVFFHERGVYVKTERTHDGAAFVTGRGAEHALRLLVPAADFHDRFVRRNATAVRNYFQAERDHAQAGNRMEELQYFVDQILPAFTARDCAAGDSLDIISERSSPATNEEPAAVIDSLASTIPAAVLPTPSVLILDRFLTLHVVKPRAASYHIRHGDQMLEPTGEEIPLSVVESRWRAEAQAWISRSLAAMAERDGYPGRSSNLDRARSEIDRTGFFQSGDLLFLPGRPPHVGHVIPPHFNRAIGRNSRRDLAMMAPLHLPPRIGQVHVYTKTNGRWTTLTLPHGLCLGPSAPHVRPESRGVALLAYLRWAAARIAANGVFHASDEQGFTVYEA